MNKSYFEKICVCFTLSVICFYAFVDSTLVMLEYYVYDVVYVS
jgi:hypothetical protein